MGSTNNGKWKAFFVLALQNYGYGNVFTGYLNIKDGITSTKVSDAFLEELLKQWAEVKFEQKITNLEQLQKQSLWHNSLITVENKPIFFKDWCSKGITKVKHLKFPENNNYRSLIEFQQEYDLNAPPLSFYGIISAVKGLGNGSIKKENGNNKEHTRPKKQVHWNIKLYSEIRVKFQTIAQRNGFWTAAIIAIKISIGARHTSQHRGVPKAPS